MFILAGKQSRSKLRKHDEFVEYIVYLTGESRFGFIGTGCDIVKIVIYCFDEILLI